MYIAAIVAIVCILHTFELPIKYQDYFCNVIIRLNESEEKKIPDIKKVSWGRSLDADKLQASLLGHACRSLLRYAGIINTASPF